ncbi:ATP synthase F0 subunit C [Candidatus Dependentiae bacterium]|nr:ATP synthase F0 subunit C [Candidatus Dependentiae bacterium]
MITAFQFLHYLIAGTIVGLNALGAGIAQGKISRAAIKAMDIQPAAKDEISRCNFLALAIIETASVIGSLFAVLLIFSKPTSIYSVIAEIAIAFSLGFIGFLVSTCSIRPAKIGLYAIARQPFLSKKITNLMLLILSLLQSAFVFGFLISIAVFFQKDNITNLPHAIKLMSAGLALGLGAIGPVIGISRFAQSALNGLAVNQHSYPKIITFTFISQAIIETPILFSLIIGVLLALLPGSVTKTNLESVTYIIIAIAAGIGTLGAGIASGKTAASACNQIALKPELYPILSRTSMIAQGLIDTCAIYAFAISLLLLIINI